MARWLAGALVAATVLMAPRAHAAAPRRSADCAPIVRSLRPRISAANDHFASRDFEKAARAYESVFKDSRGCFPRGLRNAAMCLEYLKRHDDALSRWEKLAALDSVFDVLDYREARLLHKEAVQRGSAVRQRLAQALLQRAERDYVARRFSQAANGFAQAYFVSGRTRPRYLDFAATAYADGGLLEDALVALQMFAQAPNSGIIGRADAAAKQASVRSRMAAKRVDSSARKLLRAGQFREASQAFLALADRRGADGHDHLRMAAEAMSRAEDPAAAKALWQRLAATPGVREVTRQQALDRLRVIEIAELRVAVTKSRKNKQFRDSGDLVLKIYALSLDPDPGLFREAASDYESARLRNRACTMWARLGAAPNLTTAMKREARNKMQACGYSATADSPRAPMASNRCIGCLVTASAGMVALAAGAITFGRASDDAMQLQRDLSTRNASGEITGISSEQAAAKEASINTQRLWGSVLMGVGGAVAIGGLVAQWLADDGPQQEIGLAPTAGGILAFARF